jgi:murein DD-endopeptidase
LSVLRPISSINQNSSGRFRIAIVSLLLGLGAGGAGGYFWGQSKIPSCPPETKCTQETGARIDPATAATNPETPGPATDKPIISLYSGKPVPMPEELRRLDVLISGSLYSTLARKIEGREADIINAHLGRILVWWFDLRRDVLKGDRVQVLYQPAENPEDLRLLAMRYKSRKLNKTMTAFFFKPAEARYGRYYDEKGIEVEKRLVHSPLDEYEQITERMNLAGRRHNGVDFKADVGTPIEAPYRARVERRNWNTRRNGSCLELVYLDSDIHAFFLHLDEIMPTVTPGKEVKAGTLVAKSGNSGRSTAPHLHYELHGPTGKLLDPFNIEKTSRRSLADDNLVQFKAQRDKFDKWLTPEESDRESSGSPSASSSSKAKPG